MPSSLREFADEEDLPQADVQMLSAIQFLGEPPRTKERSKRRPQAERDHVPPACRRDRRRLAGQSSWPGRDFVRCGPGRRTRRLDNA